MLRDALTAELGASPAAAMAQLRTVEEHIGAAHGLSDGRYLEAMASVCAGDAHHLSSLDDAVHQACGRVRLAPRHAQYLALMLSAHWLDAQRVDAAAFLMRLNARLDEHKPKGEAVPAFVEADLQLAAFWMVTAAGKTHVLHACLALLENEHAGFGRGQKTWSWDRIILITPSEALTRQHADKLRELSA